MTKKRLYQPRIVGGKVMLQADVARRLHGVELGDGAVAQAAREAQAALRKASPWLQAADT